MAAESALSCNLAYIGKPRCCRRSRDGKRQKQPAAPHVAKWISTSSTTPETARHNTNNVHQKYCGILNGDAELHCSSNKIASQVQPMNDSHHRKFAHRRKMSKTAHCRSAGSDERCGENRVEQGKRMQSQRSNYLAGLHILPLCGEKILAIQAFLTFIPATDRNKLGKDKSVCHLVSLASPPQHC